MPCVWVFVFAACKLFWLNKFSSSSPSVLLTNNFTWCQWMGFFLQNLRWIVEWIWKVENKWILTTTPFPIDTCNPAKEVSFLNSFSFCPLCLFYSNKKNPHRCNFPNLLKVTQLSKTRIMFAISCNLKFLFLLCSTM